MAVNDSRSMNNDFHQGIIDRSYIQSTPDRGGLIENPPLDRMVWPQYRYADRFQDHSHGEAHAVRATRPVEGWKGNTGDPRY